MYSVHTAFSTSKINNPTKPQQPEAKIVKKIIRTILKKTNFMVFSCSVVSLNNYVGLFFHGLSLFVILVDFGISLHRGIWNVGLFAVQFIFVRLDWDRIIVQSLSMDKKGRDQQSIIAIKIAAWSIY